MKTVFAYEVILYDTDQDNRGHFFITSGLSFADNFGEAAAILESTYGEMLKSIKILNLSMMIKMLSHFLVISFVTILMEENLSMKSLVIAKVENQLL